VKRTDLEVWDVRTPFWDGGCCAAAKSGEREALFGEVRVAEGLAPLEANCVVRSVSCVLRVESWSWSELESVSLGFEAAGLEVLEERETTYASGECSSWLSSASMPERKESSERDIWPSCEFGERFREIARCLSSRESLI